MKNGVNENSVSLPPLGKAIIGFAISLFGYAPFGWRIMGVLSGCVTLGAIYFMGLLLFESSLLAVQAAAFCLLNQILFVEARLAVLDPIMLAFISVGLVLFLQYWLKDKSRIYILGSFRF